MDYERVRSAKSALCVRYRVLEHINGLVEINERRFGVRGKHQRVIYFHFERAFITLSEDALRRGYCFEEE